MSGTVEKMKYDVHPDFRPLCWIHPPLGRRKVLILQRIMKLFFYLQRSGRGVRVKHVRIASESGNTVKALLYEPKEGQTKGCLLYCHGGGFAFPGIGYQYRLARMYAKGAGCRVLFPDYRLAPKHPFPAAPEDCFAAYNWLRDQQPDSPIAVGGDSAGGTLSMAICLMAHDQDVPVPCAQLLMYPYVGHCGETESLRSFTDAPLLSSRDMAQYEEWYGSDPDRRKLAYRSPIEAEDFSIFPLTYIETAEFDGLRDGAVLCAEKLRENGVSVKLNNTKGTVHGYDIMLRSEIVKAQVTRRIGFLKKALSSASMPDQTKRQGN